jgi:hypothetical protein
MTTVLSRPRDRQVHVPSHSRAFDIRGVTYGLSTALGVVTMAATTLTFLLPDVLRGTEVMNGSARGTALVALVLGVPTLVLAMHAAAIGSARGVFVWFGAVMYLAYNSFLLLLATPYNQLFVLYVAMAGLTVVTGIALVADTDLRALARSCDVRMQVRLIAVYVWVVVATNAVAWLVAVVPPTFSSEPPAFLDGTGLTTNPVYVQDLAQWLPLMGVGAVWLWRRLTIGYLLVGGGLTMWALEGVTIAADQWFGHRADPSSDVVSTAAVPGFLVTGLVTLSILVVFLRHVRPAPRDSG